MTLHENVDWEINIGEYLKDLKYTETWLKSSERQWYHFQDLPDSSPKSSGVGSPKSSGVVRQHATIDRLAMRD